MNTKKEIKNIMKEENLRIEDWKEKKLEEIDQRFPIAEEDEK